MANKLHLPPSRRRYITSELVLLALAILSGILVIWLTVTGTGGIYSQIIAGLLFTVSLIGFVRLLLDPDTSAARQSDQMLRLARATTRSMENGFTEQAAQEICERLLPATEAIAVAITDREKIMGYAGYNVENNPHGRPIATAATKDVLADGNGRVLYTYDDIGLPSSSKGINAAIVQPLTMGNKIEGTVKFYYRRASQISETQKSIARGYAELLSTQMAAAALEEQTKLATSMELKALQAQINPHFLFNTINTIASLIRTDPTKARTLLRDFAVFYRSALENANDLIVLEREIEQVERYFSFEVARFGEERLELTVDIQPPVGELLVPSFLIQPLVENSVHHAMKSEGKLNVRITGHLDGDD
ncbi:MAG: histidine kinase, partial [Eggerthellaceae bacterium]|nr:histidine kinase [Eggerthellaceae bacterium]